MAYLIFFSFKVFQSEQGKFLTALFVISWIFLGYFVLLNLFLAILLDGFAEKLNEKDALIVQDVELEDRSLQDPGEDFKVRYFYQ